MNRKSVAALLVTALLAFAGSACAQVYAGRFDDPTNAALVGSDLGAPTFTDDDAVANNVALYGFTVASAGSVTITSTGFAAGGTDPYFTLFRGAGGSATFVDSNYDQAFMTGGDFTWSGALAAGAYQIALGAFANLSFAENEGSGTLADGFIGLGEPGSLGNASYRLVVTAPVPEPSAAWLLLIGLGATGWRVARRR